MEILIKNNTQYITKDIALDVETSTNCSDLPSISDIELEQYILNNYNTIVQDANELDIVLKDVIKQRKQHIKSGGCNSFTELDNAITSIINNRSAAKIMLEEEQDIEQYYFGDIFIKQYFNLRSNLTIKVYKNIPKHYYNTHYAWLDTDNNNNSYWVRQECYLVDVSDFASILFKKYNIKDYFSK